jgi:hypothetical protein
MNGSWRSDRVSPPTIQKLARESRYGAIRGRTTDLTSSFGTLAILEQETDRIYVGLLDPSAGCKNGQGNAQVVRPPPRSLARRRVTLLASVAATLYGGR